MFEEIMKMLGIDKLDEAQVTALKEKLETIIDVKARDRADSILKEETEKLIEQYEAKFEEYKGDITSKFSNFVDTVLEEELKLPEKVIEYARKGELYEEVVELLKTRLAIDEGVLNDEVKGLLKEAKEEIVRLRKELNEETGKRMKIEGDAKSLASNLYLRKKCDGLTEAQRSKVLDILGDLTEKEEIDRKFQIVVDTILKEQDAPDAETGLAPGTTEPEPEAATFKCVCESCGVASSSKTACDLTPCPTCGGKMKDADNPTPAEELGQGKIEVDNPEGETVKEEDDPFKKYLANAVKILKENTF